jgi:hypothetical protein
MSAHLSNDIALSPVWSAQHHVASTNGYLFSTYRAVIFRYDLAIHKRNQALVYSRLIEIGEHYHLNYCNGL